MIQTLSTLVLVGLVTAAAWSDVRTRRIPNLLSYSLLALALTLRSFGGMAPLAEGFRGAGLALAIAFPLFLLGALGGGDGKLLMGVGAMLGPDRLWPALLVTALAGGVLAGGALLRRGALRGTLAGLHVMLAAGAQGEAGGWKTIRTPGSLSIPYGVAIATGALAGWFL